MTGDYLYVRDVCDRCAQPTSALTPSFFTDETICLRCLDAEGRIKAALRRRGVDLAALERCGCLPRLATEHEGAGSPAHIDCAAPQLTAADVRAALRRLREREALVRIPPTALPPSRDRRSTG